MNDTQIREAAKEIMKKHDRVAAIWDEVGDGEPSKDQLAEVKKLNQEIEQTEQRIADAKEINTERAKHQKRTDSLKTATGLELPNGNLSDDAANNPARKGMDAILGGKTIGDYFMGSEALKKWFAEVAPKGVFGEKQRVEGPPVMLPEAASKSLITGASLTSAGAMVIPDFLQQVVPLPLRPLTVRDIVTLGSTNSDTVEFPQITSFTNAAAPTAEGTSYSDSSQVKPESALALQRVTVSVKTIAHWIPVTKRALADAAQLRTVIDNFLTHGLQIALEDQVMTGDGTGEDFTGLINQSGLTSQAFDTNLLTTYRKARTKVKVVGRAIPTAYVMHPYDWEAVDLLQDNEARYYFGGPSILGNARLWGVPVVESEACPQGTAFVGDMKQMVIWDRQMASIQVTDSHSDFFIRNLVAVLCELRAAFGIMRPAAIVEVALS